MNVVVNEDFLSMNVLAWLFYFNSRYSTNQPKMIDVIKGMVVPTVMRIQVQGQA